MIIDQPSDEYLINCIKDGDIEKTSLLFERHHKNIFTYFYRLTRNKAESEDLTQNVFVRLIRLRNSYKPGNFFLPWVYRISHNVFVDYCNFKNKSNNQLNNYRHDLGETDNETEEVQLDVFYKAFDKLPVEYRELLILSRYNGLTYRQIGESLGINERAVKQKAFRALEKLRSNYFKIEKE